jgi:hypothetical protein
MLGLDLHGWELAMVWSLGVAAIAALAVVASTRVVIVLQRAENKARYEELERYKSDAAERAATLEKSASEARLETERIKQLVAWRRVSKEQSVAMGPVLVAHPFDMHLDFTQSDPEAAQFAEDMLQSLKAGGVSVYPHPLVMPPARPGIFVVGAPGPKRHALETALKSAGIAFSLNENGDAIPRLSIGSKAAPAF